MPQGKVKYIFKLVLALMWAVPWVLAAVALGMTFIGIPLAMVCWAIGCWPYNKIARARALAVAQYRDRDRVMDNDEEVPWEI